MWAGLSDSGSWCYWGSAPHSNTKQSTSTPRTNIVYNGAHIALRLHVSTTKPRTQTRAVAQERHRHMHMHMHTYTQGIIRQCVLLPTFTETDAATTHNARTMHAQRTQNERTPLLCPEVFLAARAQRTAPCASPRQAWTARGRRVLPQPGRTCPRAFAVAPARPPARAAAKACMWPPRNPRGLIERLWACMCVCSYVLVWVCACKRVYVCVCASRWVAGNGVVVLRSFNTGTQMASPRETAGQVGYTGDTAGTQIRHSPACQPHALCTQAYTESGCRSSCSAAGPAGNATCRRRQLCRLAPIFPSGPQASQPPCSKAATRPRL